MSDSLIAGLNSGLTSASDFQSNSNSDLAMRVRDQLVPAGQIAAWWLGGSGFIFKSPSGTQVFIDPYLSDAVSRTFGLRRAFPAPIRAQDAQPQIVISTHWHEDHLDPEALTIIARHNPDTRFVMPPSAVSHAWYNGVPAGQITTLQTGQSLEIEDVKIHHVFARHESGLAGWEAPDAMGVLLKIGGAKIYHSGDTEYDARLLNLKDASLDVAMVCINGVTGNMNAHEAALLLWQLQAKTVLPMHHYLWAEEHAVPDSTLDPELFAATYRKLGGQGKVVLPEVGVEFLLGR